MYLNQLVSMGERERERERGEVKGTPEAEVECVQEKHPLQ